MLEVDCIEDVREAVRCQERIAVSGGCTKSALSAAANLSLKSLQGVLQYEPTEYTFTALAGTSVAEVRHMLAAHRQYLPFDPPWVEAGATLGGTVAAGLSGAGRFRYGGVRDFLIGVRFVNGAAELVRGGGKVVKNAAGFDTPKLMVGSLGRLGVLVELTFKVFPARQASRTAIIDLPKLEDALALVCRLAVSREELDCLELEPPGRVTVRISGMRDALRGRVERLQKMLPQAAQLQQPDDDLPLWRDVAEFAWLPHDCRLVKVPVTAEQILWLEQRLAPLDRQVPRRYSVGGSLAWIGWPHTLEFSQLEGWIREIGSRGLLVQGDGPAVYLNHGGRNAFAERLVSVFDPAGKFQR